VGCRMLASPVTAVSDSLGLSNPRVTSDSSSLIISESLEGVWAVESTRHS